MRRVIFNSSFLILHSLPSRGARCAVCAVLLLLVFSVSAGAQQLIVRPDSAEVQALRRHPRLRQSTQEIEEQRALKRGSVS